MENTLKENIQMKNIRKRRKILGGKHTKDKLYRRQKYTECILKKITGDLEEFF